MSGVCTVSVILWWCHDYGNDTYPLVSGTPHVWNLFCEQDGLACLFAFLPSFLFLSLVLLRVERWGKDRQTGRHN